MTILQARLRRVFALFHALRLSHRTRTRPRSGSGSDADNEKLNAAVAELLEPDLDRLRMAPADAASALRTVTFSLTHPILGDRTIHRAGADRRPDPARHLQPTFHRTAVMLTRLLRTYLVPYRRLLIGVVILQLIGTMASLFLPSLNAAIIDQGVAKGDTAFIWHTGKVMLAVSLLQVICAIAATYLGARTAMGFGRDVRAPIFQRVLAFSSRELNHFGAPSLITRTTNDVQQVQMLVLLCSTLFVAAPITMIGGVIMALREDVGLAWLVAVAVPAAGHLDLPVIRKMRPLFRVMQDPDRPGQPGAARADHRHPGGPGLRPRAVRDRSLRRRQRRAHRRRHLGRSAAWRRSSRS